MAHYSVIETIQALHRTVDSLEEERDSNGTLARKVKEVVGNFEKLEQSWNDRAARDNWANKDYRRAVGKTAGLEQQLADLGTEVLQLQTWKQRVEGANWWQRLWRTW
jgi:predicted RNase H-like nuclease (RuvC/YqgF family)